MSETTLKDKENALRIVRFNRPERVLSGFPAQDISYFGVNHEGWDNPKGHNMPVGTRWRDIWGVGWRKEMDGIMGYAVEHPLAGLRFDSYTWPDPDDPRLVQPIYDKAKKVDSDAAFLAGSHRETLWERCYNLVGMDRLMLAFYDEPDAVRELFRRVMDFQVGIARHYIEAGITLATTGDDLGTQSGLLISPEILREFFVPEYRRLFSVYKAHGVIINHHSCGHIEPVLDVFMDLGIDVLNPLQATANNLGNVRRATQGRMCLQGGIATGLMMEGPVERIRAEVRRAIWLLGREGGYFCCPDQGMPFPKAHIEALHQAVRDYGAYPLQPDHSGG